MTVELGTESLLALAEVTRSVDELTRAVSSLARAVVASAQSPDARAAVIALARLRQTEAARPRRRLTALAREAADRCEAKRRANAADDAWELSAAGVAAVAAAPVLEPILPLRGSRSAKMPEVAALPIAAAPAKADPFFKVPPAGLPVPADYETVRECAGRWGIVMRGRDSLDVVNDHAKSIGHPGFVLKPAVGARL